jgi:hypothetical protein
MPATSSGRLLNLKARPDTIAAFCAVARLGETLEKAVALLEREFRGRWNLPVDAESRPC